MIIFSFIIFTQRTRHTTYSAFVMMTSNEYAEDALPISREKDPDFTIMVMGKEICAHRRVLSEKSGYFRGMLSHDTLENQSGTVEMKDVEFKAVQACIDFIYGTEVKISIGNYEELLHVSSIMQLELIKDKISQFLQNSVDVKSIFRVRAVALRYFLKDLVEFCDKFCLENLASIATNPEFNEFDLEHLSMLITSKKSVHPKREDSKLAIILNWVKADAENRKTLFEQLFSLLNLPQISKSFLKFVLLKEQVILASGHCMDKLSLAGLNPDDLVRNADVEETPNEEICFQPQPNAIVFTDRATSKLHAYFPESKTHEQFGPKVSHSGGVHDFIATENYVQLYVVFEHRSMFCMDMSDDRPRWMKMKDMVSGHGWAIRGAYHSDFIYVIGSYCGERYNTADDEWSPIPGHRLYMNGCAVAVCSGFIYTIGEYGSHGEGSRKAQRLCTKTLEWSAAGAMSIERFRPVAATRSENIYVAGGTYDTDSPIECYSHKTGNWTRLTTMLDYVDVSPSCGLCWYDNNLFVMSDSRIWAYDLDKNEWNQQPDSLDISIEWSLSYPVFTLRKDNAAGAKIGKKCVERKRKIQ